MRIVENKNKYRSSVYGWYHEVHFDARVFMFWSNIVSENGVVQTPFLSPLSRSLMRIGHVRHMEDINQVVISYEIYQTSLRRV